MLSFSIGFFPCLFSVSSSQAKPSLTANAANASNVGGKAMNSIKKAVAIKGDSEEAKPLVATSNGRSEWKKRDQSLRKPIQTTYDFQAERSKRKQR